MNTLLSIIIIFGLLVFVHEWGHLYFAKRAGILCREFAIGFGPKVFSFKRDETVYTIRLLPLGGFVRMAGEDPETVHIKPGYDIGLIFNETNKVSKMIVNNKTKHPEAKIVSIERIDLEKDLVIRAYVDDDLVTYAVDERAEIIYDEEATQIAPLNRQFGSKSIPQRALAIFAGPLMNFLLAAIILTCFAFIAGTPVDRAEVGMVSPEGAAFEAGLQENDMVVAIGGHSVEKWTELTAIIQAHPKQELLFEIERAGQRIQVPVTPQERLNQEGQTEGFIGIGQPTEFSFFGSLKYGVVETYNFTVLIFTALGQLVAGQFSLDDLAGPVGIYNYTGQAADMGILVLMRWAAVLSVNLGIINLLPLPALDGGRLLFIGVEAVRGKPIDPQKEGLIHFIGFALLMLLMLVVTWNDINKFFM
ncbi:RIP metalloprotease RseP [Bacillus alkalicellulosilyticus]|uniref:RIP metalloprotease RseP n=1 Tax=Alkalihalobacterium alkalicellulosilyticum TaxID=1912214 RepID=UPI0009980AA5|nr:RIP metalloprotease RseP [Bacillus alkalicellulosilyticus]